MTRPLTSLWLLAILVGASAILSGILGLSDAEAESRGRVADLWYRVICVLWIVGGVAVLVWLGRSIELLPAVLSLLLILGGLGSLAGVSRGRVSERVLAVASGGAQIVFGILALVWPDLTLLIAAVLFGVRTTIYGASLIWRAGRRLAGKPAPRRRIRGARGDVGCFWMPAGTRSRSTLVVLAGSAWWVNSWLADGAPGRRRLLRCTRRRLPMKPGVLIRSDAYAGQAPAGGEVRRILYSTTDAVGVRAVASALVISPIDPPSGPRPVISWNWGTTGVARGCAPSLMDSTATRWAIPAVEQALARGWVVVALRLQRPRRRWALPVPDRRGRGALEPRRDPRGAAAGGPAPLVGCRGVGALAGRARRAVDRAGRGRLRARAADPGHGGALAAHRSARHGAGAHRARCLGRAVDHGRHGCSCRTRTSTPT